MPRNHASLGFLSNDESNNQCENILYTMFYEEKGGNGIMNVILRSN